MSFGSVWDLFLVHSIFLLCARVPSFCYLLRYSLMYDFMQPLKFCREKSKKYIYKKPENIEISFSLCLCIINLEIYLKTLLSLTQTPNRDINPRVLWNKLSKLLYCKLNEVRKIKKRIFLTKKRTILNLFLHQESRKLMKTHSSILSGKEIENKMRNVKRNMKIKYVNNMKKLPVL